MFIALRWIESSRREGRISVNDPELDAILELAEGSMGDVHYHAAGIVSTFHYPVHLVEDPVFSGIHQF